MRALALRTRCVRPAAALGRALAPTLPCGAAAFHATRSARDTWAPWEGKSKPGDSHAELHEMLEHWSPTKFYYAGAGMTAGLAVIAIVKGPFSVAALATAIPVALWWRIGLADIAQTKHTIKRNFPVIGNLRYLLESIRPEIRQYFIETEHDANPITRAQRTLVYQRAKGTRDTLPFGTRGDVYATGHEWANHSLYPKVATLENSRVMFGGPACKQPYSGSVLNISGMSLQCDPYPPPFPPLSQACKAGNFYHNTGEGGISEYHLEHGGDLVWNIGTGYFGCRAKDGGFDPIRFTEQAAIPSVKMIEIKLSQGAKPAHGGMLPKSKITPAIAAARGISMDDDCNSPPAHSAFNDPRSLMLFIAKLRELSLGKPIGLKMCVGRPDELLALAHAMVKKKKKMLLIGIEAGV
ncbi:hypothetical protein T492DRAFT_605102 [Pavlovales sp. CCMP2436]|nr:hypothetical protein T492DRAFT_605102 [Pavlovales sp. CCMP2436]